MQKQQKPRFISPYAIFSLSLFLALGFAFVLSRFYHLQITEQAVWKKKAMRQQQELIDVPAKRGSIYLKGNEYKAFVIDKPTYHLYLDPLSIPSQHKNALSHLLVELLGIPKEKVDEELYKKSHFRKLVMFLDLEKKEAILKAFKKFAKKKKIPKNGIFFLEGYTRAYPLGSMAGSLIQTLGAQEGLRGPERFPSGGLEKRFDSLLKGKNGTLVSFRTPKGRLDDFKVLKKPQDGADLYLSLHPLIQTVVEEQLKNAVDLAEAKGGWAVMMDPYSGALMALAQYPQLDLLDPKKLLDDPIKKEYLQMKCLTDPFEPGSIIKPFTMLTCLKANRELAEKKQAPCFFPKEKVACLDGRFPGRKNPIKDVHAYHYLDMQMALQKSSNIYMAKSIHKVIQSLGDDFYANTLKQMCDFGKKTKLNLGSESSGFVPTPHKKTRSGRPEWSTPTPYSLAMGYNLLATSLQMTKAFAMIANGGMLVEPYLIEKIVKKKEGGLDEVLLDQALIPKKKIQKMDEEDCHLVKMAMRYALMPGGTAFRARIPGYSCAGKTATTEKLSSGVYSKDCHISTFVGFAPVEKPRFVLLIVIDEPKKKIIPNVGKNQFGGVCAAPSFAIIGQKALEILGEPQDDPGSIQAFSQSQFSQEHKQLETLFKSWNH